MLSSWRKFQAQGNDNVQWLVIGWNQVPFELWEGRCVDAGADKLIVNSMVNSLR